MPHAGREERVSPMNHISKIAIVLVAVALVIVIGLIVLNASAKQQNIQPTPEPTVQATAEPTQEPTAEPTNAPEETAQDEAQENGEMYEGALAGLTEEEIGRLAMAEEQHGSGETDEETAEEDACRMEHTLSEETYLVFKSIVENM